LEAVWSLARLSDRRRPPSECLAASLTNGIDSVLSFYVPLRKTTLCARRVRAHGIPSFPGGGGAWRGASEAVARTVEVRC
jgi:hypothetical protein